jgi:hypothetical protein
VLEYCLKLIHDCLLHYPFEFAVHLSTCQLMLRSVSYLEHYWILKEKKKGEKRKRKEIFMLFDCAFSTMEVTLW